jgi:acyl carrier protein
VAYNGSEPVRWETLNRFAACFADAGFSRQAFYPCYGLAEATLLVTGVKGGGDPFCFEKEGKMLVGSGRAPRGMEVKIISMDTGTVCGDLEEGEICIHGESVTRGYWNADNRSIFLELAGDRYYKTGDLGFLLNGELFVSGRSKEMLIIRGRNFYPADIGEIVAQSHAAVDMNGVAVFEWRQAEEEWIVVAEIKRAMLSDLRAEEAIDKIDRAIQGTYGFRPFDIVLTTPFSIPRTTSGKLQRLQCKDHYAQKLFKNIGTKRDMERSATVQPKNDQLIGAMLVSPDKETIKQYLINLIGSKIESLSCDWSDPTVDLTEIGIDSIKAMELMNTINRDLSINIDGARLFRDRTLGGLIALLENILWLKNAQPSGKEITI